MLRTTVYKTVILPAQKRALADLGDVIIFRHKIYHKTFRGRAPPGTTGGAYSAPADPLAGLRGRAPSKGEGKGREKWRGKGGKGTGRGSPKRQLPP